MKIPEKFKALDRYQKGVMLAMAAMIVVFAALYAYTVGRMGYEYRDAILVPSEENGATVYSGRLHGRRAEFTVSADGTVEFRRGDTLYGPYTAREDPSAVPEEHELKEDMCGVELRCGDEIIFRGGVLDRRDSLLLYNEDGTASSAGFVVTTNGGMAIDGSGNVIDPLEPGANNVLELLSGPELTHKGSWWGYFAGIFICLITAASIIYADELFRWGLSFSIRHPERAEPSDWEIAGRYISWTALAVMALAVFIIGLRA